MQELLKTLARNHAITRTVLDICLLVAPDRAGRSWLGDGVTDDAGGAVALRALAVRDMVLGVGTLSALRAGAPVKRWFQLGVLVEVVELAAMARRKDRLGPASSGWAAVTAAGALGGLVLALGLRD